MEDSGLKKNEKEKIWTRLHFAEWPTKCPVLPELASPKTSAFFSKTRHFWPKSVNSRATAAPTAPHPMMTKSKISESIFFTNCRICSTDKEKSKVGTLSAVLLLTGVDKKWVKERQSGLIYIFDLFCTQKLLPTSSSEVPMGTFQLGKKAFILSAYIQMYPCYIVMNEIHLWILLSKQ